MKNIWFIRTDKDGQEFDVTVKSPFIYSIHGICGNVSYTSKHKNKIFPKLILEEKELIKLVKSIKNQLIEDDMIDSDDPGKDRCDLAIKYWVKTMEDGDLVFVRNKYQEVLVCVITGYVSESFFDQYGFFQRPVNVLGKLTNDPTNEKLWNRTMGRKTIEKNASNEIETLALNFLKTFKMKSVNK